MWCHVISYLAPGHFELRSEIKDFCREWLDCPQEGFSMHNNPAHTHTHTHIIFCSNTHKLNH